MTGQMNTEVRLVRCPRCRLVLPELAEVPVYKCGGCGAILQAKNRKREIQDTGSLAHEEDTTQKNGLEHVSEDKKEFISSIDESDLDTSCERGGSGMDCRREGLGCVNQSHEFLCSDAISCHENSGSSPEARTHMEAEEDKFREDHNVSGDDDSEQPGDTSVSNEISLSPELNRHENESSVPASGAYDNEESSSPKKVDENQYSSENESDRSKNKSQNCNRVWPISTSFSKDTPSDECNPHERENLSPVARTEREVDESLKSFRSLSAEAFLITSPNDQISADQSCSGEIFSSDNHKAPCTEPMEQAQEGILPGFQRVSSVDTLENMALIYDRTDLGVTLRSPTARKYYAYDGTVSSCNETNDQVSNRHFHRFKRNFKDADSNSPKGLPKRDEFMMNHVMSSDSDLQARPMNSSSALPAKKHHATKGSKWHRGEFWEPTRRSHQVKSTDEYLSRLPYNSNVSQTSYRNGSSSSYGQKYLPEKPESDKMELLRMVCELEDQLNRTQISKGMPHGRFSTRVAKKEDPISPYDDFFGSQREKYPNLNYPRYPGRHSQDKTWFQQDRVSRMAFSGDATQCRHQVECSCLHCCHQEWHYSAQMPPRAVCCNKGHSMAHPRHNWYSPYHFDSPQYYTASEFSLWSHDTKSDDQQHNDSEVQKMHQPAKRHFRPIAGGSPIIACYCCSEMLQLPADFLHFTRRCHQLKCSACSKVLKFSLESRRHLVQYSPDPIAPPPSEVHDFSDTIKRRNLASASGASACPHAEPVSYSDDYGRSFCRSCSTDAEHSSVAPPFENVYRISDHRKMSAGSYLETKKEGKKKSIMEEPENKYSSHAESFDSAGGPSSKMLIEKSFSEIEELPPEGVSPLHQLMGYPSPSRLVYK